MRRIVLLILALVALAPVPSWARRAEVTVVEVTVVEEWTTVEGTGRFVDAAAPDLPPSVAAYGPFRVLDDERAALVDVTDAASPGQFAAMLRAFPGLATVEMIECPGTADDRANLAVGRMIRAAGLATHVPRGGSVRSGAVELFLAGAARRIDDGAEFAVHSWQDDLGREPGDFAADAPENRTYVDYYTEMGMPRATARAFYAMTNSVPNGAAKWLTAQDMRGWLREADSRQPMAPQMEQAPALAYLDLATALP